MLQKCAQYFFHVTTEKLLNEFHEIWHWGVLLRLISTSLFFLKNRTKITITLYEDMPEFFSVEVIEWGIGVWGILSHTVTDTIMCGIFMITSSPRLNGH